MGSRKSVVTTRFIARRRRSRISRSSPRSCPGTSRLDRPPKALPALKIQDGPEQLRPIEIRPQSIGDVELGISDLPEQEVADAHFARRADQQIRFRKTRGIEAARNHFIYVDDRLVPGPFDARFVDRAAFTASTSS